MFKERYMNFFLGVISATLKYESIRAEIREPR